MASLTWYLNRLKTMSAAEVAWRVAERWRDLQLWCRLTSGLEPRFRCSGPVTADHSGPGFRVSDVSVGEWADPERLDERGWRDRLIAKADGIAAHRLSFFDLLDCDLGNPIDWNRDHGTGQKAPLRFAPLVDYRNARIVGDAKVVWEPNRHHHLVVLGRAYRATGNLRYASEVLAQLASWLDQCAFGRGMNWRSPLELAVRLINWVWTVDLIRESGLVTGTLERRWRRAAYLHLWQIAHRYSRGSSANNHRIGEAVGVFVGSSYLVELADADRLRRESQRILVEEILAQTYPDGGSREQAVGYHVFVLELLMVAAIVGRNTARDFPDVYWARLEQMFEFLGALREGGSALPMIGDSDDGYVLDLGDNRDIRGLFGIAAGVFRREDFRRLAGGHCEAARWLLGRSGWEAVSEVPSPDAPRLVSRALPDSGYYVLQCGKQENGCDDRISVVFDCGDLGFQSIAAHGHADALSFVLRAFGADVFVDPGTYDYFSHPAWRTYFRSTRAHNAVVVDDEDQSVLRGPFLWGHHARARCIVWQPMDDGGRVVGEHDGYARLKDPVLHRRTVELSGATGTIRIWDEIVANGRHDIAIVFHLAEDAVLVAERPNGYEIAIRNGVVMLGLDARLEVEQLRGCDQPIGGWVSRGYHRKVPTTMLIARGRCLGNDSFASRIDLRRVPQSEGRRGDGAVSTPAAK